MLKLKELIDHLTNFLYPPVCLHCNALLGSQNKIFCPECFQELQLIDPKERCRYCFGYKNDNETKTCSLCAQTPPPWNRGAAAFDYEGAAATLITSMKYGNQAYLSKGAAALMASQFHALNWPFPDLIIPVPIPFSRWIQRGYNQSLNLANDLGKILNKPILSALTRKGGDYSQAGLSSSQRKKLNTHSFVLKKTASVQNKKILLIDDVMTTGSTLQRCAEVLLDGAPKHIYVLTVCRAI